ncbi:uncharacterized protein MONBRDRAFT_34000 [Monosiga brevicollis MX1]|uniref:ACB domain-containing protein n=1 Tax=Monosiga brevicollis TaxID=81824 RepID=A9V913_MONBE|nr:uncharacterized protein MONBRDRAFT_34000 [Monosiga brevicollis MX1]EDQ86049.1 predicted protein [Monosiga brevicollis MX1]|eukprot:XP_001749243.1 hypothetical protein [Monosiga brevicollis MX1]
MAAFVDEAAFTAAAQRIRDARHLALDNDAKLALYGLYKQGSEGPCNMPKPGIFDFAGRAKWAAWQELGSLDQAVAQAQYVALVNQHLGLAHVADAAAGESSSGSESESESAASDSDGCDVEDETVQKSNNEDDKGATSLGAVQSTLLPPESGRLPADMSLHELAADGQLPELQARWAASDLDIDVRDEDGMTMLHWATDHGQTAVGIWLIEHGANVNLPDAEGTTALHNACYAQRQELVSRLLAAGADRTAVSGDGELAEDIWPAGFAKS